MSKKFSSGSGIPSTQIRTSKGKPENVSKSAQSIPEKRWDSQQSVPKKNTPSSSLSVEDQITRANAIAGMNADDFTPQSFVSRRIEPEKLDKVPRQKQKGQQDLNRELTGILAGPVENLISPVLIAGSEEERSKRLAENLTTLRRRFLQETGEPIVID